MNIHPNHTIRIIVATVALLLAVSCQDEYMDQSANGLTSDGRVRLSLRIDLPDAAIIATRSSTDPSITEKSIDADRTFMLVLDAPSEGIVDNLELKQKPAKIDAINTASGTIDVKLFQETTGSYLCLLANLSPANVAYINTLAAGTATLGEIKQALRLPLPGIGLAANNLPMSGYSTHLPSITPTTVTSGIQLERSTARIDLTTDPVISSFYITSATITNAPQRGWMLSDNTFLRPWNGLDVGQYNLVNATGNTIESLIYPYEKAGMRPDGITPNPTRIVICGHNEGESADSYFPYDIVYKDATGTNNLYDINRNKLYRITIKRVGKTGYATLDEAAQAEPFNAVIDAIVDVKDPYAHDIITNGRQYLATTNANFIIYPLDGNVRNNIHIATLSYTTDPKWSNGTLTLTGKDATGNTINGFVLSSNLSSSGNLEVRADGSVIYRDILVNIPGNMATGTIVVHIGNLRKELYVTRKLPTVEAGTVIKDYSNSLATPIQTFTDFKTGEINSPSAATSWLKVSIQEGNAGASSLLDRVTNPNGGVYLHVLPNIVFEGGVRPREASAYVSGDNDNLRTKILVQQQSIDVYSGGKQIFPFSYVGTFHRWNQTGERLIRIDASTELGTDASEAWWQATVVAGQEFIVLDTEPSKDPGIHVFKANKVTVNAYGDDPVDNPQWDTDAKIELNTQLSSKLRTVNGGGGNIYFRVGMASRLSSPEAQPRYGLIAITYGAKEQPAKGTHFIYVRQGETADYLMRPWDPSTQPKYPAGMVINGVNVSGQNSRPIEFNSPNRPLATKFTPYNLTDPLRETGIIDRGAKNYTFVQYPSQGGYYFGANTTKAIDPITSTAYSSNDLVGNRSSEQWNFNWESCPKGYRRPNDGHLHSRPDVSKNFINASELRQSLWLYPLMGVARSDFSNQLRGYIADGYFDRRQITLTKNKVVDSAKKQAYGIVSLNSADHAYWGLLVFNPYNYASIFVPFSGARIGFMSSSSIVNKGELGGFFCTNVATGNYNSYSFGAYWKLLMVQYGYTADSNSSGKLDNTVFDNYGMTDGTDYYSIRCVKDENPPILVPDGGSGNNSDINDPEDGGTLLSIRHVYNSSSTSLEEQIKAEYMPDNKMKQISSLILSGSAQLTDADYLFLNQWANATSSYSGYNLRHLMLRSAVHTNIPSDAFASNKWSSITLLETSNVKAGAFTPGVGMTNLIFGNYDDISIEPGAFGSNTQNVQLHLSGKEYSLADKVKNEWKGYKWKSIKLYR